jgi:hypothetical protein
VSISVWPRSRKARTAAALEVASIQPPIIIAPSTVAGRACDTERDMATEAGDVNKLHW